MSGIGEMNPIGAAIMLSVIPVWIGYSDDGWEGARDMALHLLKVWGLLLTPWILAQII